jgi:hypothetical protein
LAAMKKLIGGAGGCGAWAIRTAEPRTVRATAANAAFLFIATLSSQYGPFPTGIAAQRAQET